MNSGSPAMAARCMGSRGFTLIDLMIAVAVVAILVAIAVPGYSAYVTRSQRGAAKAALLQASQYLERNYTAYGCYDYDTTAAACAATAALPNPNAPNSGGVYTYQLTVQFPAPVGQSFQLAAAPCGTSATACPAAPASKPFTDTQCGALLLDNTGQQAIDPSGAGSWAGADTVPSDVTNCWQR